MSEQRRLALYAWRRHCMLSLGEAKVLLQSARSSPGSKACPRASRGQLLLVGCDDKTALLLCCPTGQRRRALYLAAAQAPPRAWAVPAVCTCNCVYSL